MRITDEVEVVNWQVDGGSRWVFDQRKAVELHHIVRNCVIELHGSLPKNFDSESTATFRILGEEVRKVKKPRKKSIWQVIHFWYTWNIMATTKTRINISLSDDVEKALKALAKRDQVPSATKAAELLRLALEIEEDYVFSKIADDRLAEKNIKWLKSEEVWGK